MKIAMSRTRERFPLSYKKIIKKTLASAIVFTIIFLMIYAVFAFAIGSGKPEIISWLGIVTFGIFGFLFLIVLLTYLYQRWYFAVYFYDLANDFIQIKKGPITPREITIPYERIQDVYVDQDLLDRFFGLYDVHLSSATISSGMEAHIDGVEKQAAEGLRAILLETIHQRISKSAGKNVLPNQSAQ